MRVGIGIAYLQLVGNARASKHGIGNRTRFPRFFVVFFQSNLFQPADVGSPLATQCKKQASMKEKHNVLSMRQTYEAPKAEIIVLENFGVLCGSGGANANANSTQSYQLQNVTIVI